MPIVLEGEAEAVLESSGIVDQPLFNSLTINAKPGDIPTAITVDISDLEIGDADPRRRPDAAGGRHHRRRPRRATSWSPSRHAPPSRPTLEAERGAAEAAEGRAPRRGRRGGDADARASSPLRRAIGDRAGAGTPADLLVVGLGNPGAEYDRTRHNVGAEVVELLADAPRRHAAERGKERALRAPRSASAASRVALAFPQTYMNDSGQSVALLVRRHGIEDPTQVVVVHDELDLPPGRVKVKVGGGLAGHNGLRSIKAAPAHRRLRPGPHRRRQAARRRSRAPTTCCSRPARPSGPSSTSPSQEAADAVEPILADGRRRGHEPLQRPAATTPGRRRETSPARRCLAARRSLRDERRPLRRSCSARPQRRASRVLPRPALAA